MYQILQLGNHFFCPMRYLLSTLPSLRSYPSTAAPPATWSAVVVWRRPPPSTSSVPSPSPPAGSVCAYVIKMDRQTVECKEFRPDQESYLQDWSDTVTLLGHGKRVTKTGLPLEPIMIYTTDRL